MNKLRTLREIAVALAVTIYVEVAVRRHPLPVLTRRLGIRLDLDSGMVGADDAVLPLSVQRRTRAAARVLNRWPFGDTCLRRCLVLGHRLRHLDPTLRIGVSHGGDGSVEAHSWLEIDGKTLDPQARDYGALMATDA